MQLTLKSISVKLSGAAPPRNAEDVPRAVPAADLPRDGLRHDADAHHGQQAPRGRRRGGRRHRHGDAGWAGAIALSCAGWVVRSDLSFCRLLDLGVHSVRSRVHAQTSCVKIV